MKKFEVGKRYNDGTATFEITARTAKTVKFVMIQHPGKSNERRCNEKKAKISKWDEKEVFMTNCYTVEA